MAHHQNGETLRQTAERALIENCGDEFQAQILGNAPFSHFTNKYSKKFQESSGVRGEKIFVFKAFFQDKKHVENTSSLKWMTRDEMLQNLEPSFRKSLSKIIYSQ